MSEDLYIRFYAGFINNTAIGCYLSDTIEAGKTGNAVMYFRDYSLDFNEIREVGDIDVSLFGRDEEYNTLFETGLVNVPSNLHGKVDQTFNAKGEELDITWAEGDEDDIKISLMDKYYKPGEIIDDINVYKSLDAIDDDQVGYAHFRVNVE